MELEQGEVILVVEGEETARKELRASLQTTALPIEECGSVQDALAQLETKPPDIVVAEVRLPDASGFSLCRSLREDDRSRELPVILVSHWSSEMDRILAFDCGADDFLPRPFSGRELSSRVSALLRRRRDRQEAGGGATSKTATDHLPAVTSPICEARVDGRRLDLTPKEAAILANLATSDGCVRTRRQLIEMVWKSGASPTDRCIDSHVKSLRRKLGKAGEAIETVRGVGYRFTPHPDLELA